MTPESTLKPHELSDPATWVDEHGDYLYRYAYMRLRDPDVAEDALQETLLAALKARERFSGKSTERTWLVGILKHKITDYLRTKFREQPISEFDLEEEGKSFNDLFDRFDHWKQGIGNWETNPAELLKNDQFWQVLEKCVENLPKRHAQIFTMRVMEELDSDEICKVSNISTTNLNVILHRARVKIRSCLDENWFQE